MCTVFAILQTNAAKIILQWVIFFYIYYWEKGICYLVVNWYKWAVEPGEKSDNLWCQKLDILK